MKNLSWKAVLKNDGDGVISACLKVKYKDNVCKSFVPDISNVTVDDYDASLKKELKAVFGKKKGKKIFKQVTKDFMEL